MGETTTFTVDDFIFYDEPKAVCTNADLNFNYEQTCSEVFSTSPPHNTVITSPFVITYYIGENKAVDALTSCQNIEYFSKIIAKHQFYTYANV